jgi:uncharacterized membrane protein (DUF485 family)
MALPETSRRKPAGEAAGPRDGAVEAVANSDAYRRLVTSRRRFTLVAAGLFYGLLATFAVLSAWAQDFMAKRITSGLTVGYLAAVLVFIAVWALVFAYARTSVSVFDPLAEDAKAAQRQ